MVGIDQAKQLEVGTTFFHDSPKCPTAHRMEGSRKVNETDYRRLLVAVAYFEGAPDVEDMVDTAPAQEEPALDWARTLISNRLEPSK